MKIEKIIPNGYGLSTDENGKKFFFWNALPGEIVTDYEITKNKKSYTEAIATTIKNPSKHRIEPKDACFLSTSPFQIMDYGHELKTKQNLVRELFREHNIDVETPAIATDNKDYFYRNKMEYSLYFDHSDEKIHLSFHRRGSHQKIPITKSSIERPEIFQKATEIVNDLNLRHEEARKYQSLVLRCNRSGAVSGGLFENGKPHPIFKNLTDDILGQTYSYSPNGFFQINLPVYEMALRDIAPHVTTDEVLDLYAGVGTIGLSVARDRHLTLVESDKSAYQELFKNCKSVGSDRLLLATSVRANAFAVFAKSEQVLGYIKPEQTIILDPPRAGLDPKLTAALLEVAPKKIIYLSCNPATQARDVKILLERYRIDFIKSYNFFPRTPHIENLVILSR